ncbi:MAG: hypothetical protein V4513_07090 [Pseudomonadota bacterium]
MSLLRLLNVQGIAGLVASAGLALFLLLAKGEARHWKEQSAQFEQLYRAEQAAFAATVANVRAAAEAARAADAANASRVAAEQKAINERTADDYQARIAAARAAAANVISGRLRRDSQGAANSSSGAKSSVSGLSAAPGGLAQAAVEDRLPDADALTATEQAIQLDELINWIRAQAKVDNNSRI